MAVAWSRAADMSTFQRTKRAQAARPPPSVAAIRNRVIKKLLLIVESDERPEAVISASRVLLDLPPERERTAEAAQSDADRRATAAQLVADAFAEIMKSAPEPPLLDAPPGEAVATMIEAVPAPAAEGNGNAVAVTPLTKPPIPFAKRYGRRLNARY